MTTDRVRVFLVEDQPQLLKQLVKVLSVFDDLELVGQASDGLQAVTQIQAIVPQLVLLDLELPGIDGIEVTRRIKAFDANIEVLILTTFDDEQKVFEAIRAGASGYLVKRVSAEKIRSAIHDVMNGGVVLEPAIAKRFWNLFNAARAQPPQPNNPWKLTPLELDVLSFLAKGLSNAEVGRVLSIERRTVKTHLSHIYKKMNVHSHVEAVVLATRNGLLQGN